MDLTMHCELGRHQMRDHMMQETWWGIFSYLLIDAHPISSVGNGVACETTSQTYPCVQVYGLACHFELRGSRLPRRVGYTPDRAPQACGALEEQKQKKPEPARDAAVAACTALRPLTRAAAPGAERESVGPMGTHHKSFGGPAARCTASPAPAPRALAPRAARSQRDWCRPHRDRR